MQGSTYGHLPSFGASPTSAKLFCLVTLLLSGRIAYRAVYSGAQWLRVELRTCWWRVQHSNCCVIAPHCSRRRRRKYVVCLFVEREGRRNTFVEVEAFQQAGLLQSLSQSACWTRQARTLLPLLVTLYQRSHSLYCPATVNFCAFEVYWRKMLMYIHCHITGRRPVLAVW